MDNLVAKTCGMKTWDSAFPHTNAVMPSRDVALAHPQTNHKRLVGCYPAHIVEMGLVARGTRIMHDNGKVGAKDMEPPRQLLGVSLNHPRL